MDIVFRVDASTALGSGHVIRCLTLAEALHRCKAHITFVCLDLPGNLTTLIVKRGFRVISIPCPKSGSSSQHSPSLSSFYGQSQQRLTEDKDALATIKALGANKPDWLIVDNYSLSNTWEKLLRPFTKKIMVIDDLANRTHCCDLLLDQNYVGSVSRGYDQLTSDKAELLLGPEHALIHPEYSKVRKLLVPHKGVVNSALVFFGGSDNDNLTTMAIDALTTSHLRSIFLNVVIGVNHKNTKSVVDQCTARGGTRFHTALPHLAYLMQNADLFIGAGGSTNWERLCLGLPALVIATADNQIPINEALARDNLIEYLGPSKGVAKSKLTKTIQRLIDSPTKLIRQSSVGISLVDGLGTNRVIKTMQRILRSC